MSVKPVPEGWQALVPYLYLEDAASMLEFYQRAFGAEVIERIPGPEGRVMHAELRIEGCVMMVGDAAPEKGVKSPRAYGGSPHSTYLYLPDVDAVTTRAVEAGAKQHMPPTDMFWGDRMAHVEDPSGHMWYLATHQKDLTPEEIAEAARASGHSH